MGTQMQKAYANKHFQTVLINYIGGGSISIVNSETLILLIREEEHE